MNRSKSILFIPDFSHIYIEKRIKSHPLTDQILHRFPGAIKIEIDHYKDIFNRPRQNFFIQKNTQKLILAEKKDQRIYPGAEVCHDFGNKHFYYTSSILNCIYNCDYCYLQGMFPSSNIVIFVNIEDFFSDVEALLEKHPVYLAISYDTDLLAFENIVSFTSKWINFAQNHFDLKIEVRTKSVNYSAVQHLPPSENVILAWTVSPDEVIKKYEPKTPSLNGRLQAIKKAMNDGWKVRLCFDPLLHIKNWRQHYKECIDRTFVMLPPDKIEDISIGVFRMSREYLKNIRKNRTDSALIYYPFECKDGVYQYPDHITRQLIEYVFQLLSSRFPSEKIYI
ncbi:hypothetical protein L1765_09400 [Microaerobacter geothermalis]|uniref:SPL family radical SAM protein n=1 Tax=Microaerobacter geothermalis TaxID=674972 RepID=UPI001F2A5D6E|nr:hypothetical protein [Microaerobacter geothermalis]MCF6094178.1 hypothetical protein [Microaerobacter geothermalis]